MDKKDYISPKIKTTVLHLRHNILIESVTGDNGTQKVTVGDNNYDESLWED